jgi:hypothetical protein
MRRVETTGPTSDATTQLLQDSHPNHPSLNPRFRYGERSIRVEYELAAQVLAGSRRVMEHALRASTTNEELKVRRVDELEEVKAIVSDAGFRGSAVEARRIGEGAHKIPTELPRRALDKSGHRTI